MPIPAGDNAVVFIARFANVRQYGGEAPKSLITAAGAGRLQRVVRLQRESMEMTGLVITTCLASSSPRGSCPYRCIYGLLSPRSLGASCSDFAGLSGFAGFFGGTGCAGFSGGAGLSAVEVFAGSSSPGCAGLSAFVGLSAGPDSFGCLGVPCRTGSSLC